MGAQTQGQALAGGAAARMQAANASREGIQQRRAALRGAEGGEEVTSEGIVEAIKNRRGAGPQTGRASMFPGEAPGAAPAPSPSGFEEATYRRGEVTRERDRSGRREELFRDFQNAAAERGGSSSVAPGGAVERGAGVFGAPFGGAGQNPRSGIAFGPGRSNRMPDAGTPEYQQLVERMRSMGR
jgi:hypothetical protein